MRDIKIKYGKSENDVLLPRGTGISLELRTVNAIVCA